jgi:gamma-glutamyltranspeptidase
MCPAIVTQGGIATLAVGATGGTRIPSTLCEILLNYVGLNADMETALAAPRMDTDGTLNLGIDKRHSAEEEAFFKKLGYQVARRAGAYAGAVCYDPKTKRAHGQAGVAV